MSTQYLYSVYMVEFRLIEANGNLGPHRSTDVFLGGALQYIVAKV